LIFIFFIACEGLVILKKILFKVREYPIGRLILTGDLSKRTLKKLLKKFTVQHHENLRLEFLVTPGGFLRFKFPKDLPGKFSIEELEQQHLPELQSVAIKRVEQFFKKQRKRRKKRLQQMVNYITVGVDGWGPIEKKIKSTLNLSPFTIQSEEKVIHLTGKFYPTEDQKEALVKVLDLDSHFQKLNGHRVLLLGCHDLSAYNPRGRANSKAGSWKYETSKRFRDKCQAFQPEIVLQHPHTTDTPNIWRSSWNSLLEELPSVQHYAGGVNYARYDKEGKKMPNRKSLDKVIDGTRGREVFDFVG
jgi:hypothetical protein